MHQLSNNLLGNKQNIDSFYIIYIVRHTENDSSMALELEKQEGCS